MAIKKEAPKRDSPREVKVRIIRALVDSLNNNTSIASLAKKTKSHFPTTKKYILELEKENTLHVIRVDSGTIVGVCLNYNSFGLICEALKGSKLLDVKRGENK